MIFRLAKRVLDSFFFERVPSWGKSKDKQVSTVLSIIFSTLRHVEIPSWAKKMFLLLFTASLSGSLHPPFLSAATNDWVRGESSSLVGNQFNLFLNSRTTNAPPNLFHIPIPKHFFVYPEKKSSLFLTCAPPTVPPQHFQTWFLSTCFPPLVYAETRGGTLTHLQRGWK